MDTEVFSHWFEACNSLLIGQTKLLQDLILNFFHNYSKIPGFHGIIIDGLTGNGKTALGLTLAKTCPFPKENVIFKDAVEFYVNSQIGGSERDLHKFFSSSSSQPSLLILDHAESIFSLSKEVGDVDSDASASYFLDSHSIESKMYLLARSQIDRSILSKNSTVFCILLVEDKNNISAELKRPGRFSRHFSINISTLNQRRQLLEHFLTAIPFQDSQSKEECIEILSGQPTSGFTVSDIQGLIQRTILASSNVKDSNTVLTNEKQKIFTLNDFLLARHFVNPSSIVSRVSLSIKDVVVDSEMIIGLEEQKESLYQYISAIFRNDNSVPLPRGILLDGPSGCGKSLLAASLAKLPYKPKNSSKILSLPVNFIAVDSTQIISKYFGRSDKNLSEIFAEARRAAPCFLFFDQIDTLVGRRASSEASGSESNTSDRLVTTFLVEMDGLKTKLDADNAAVIVVGTTNKKKLIDPAILRPGRLDLHVHVPLPTRKCRLDFITNFTSRSLDEHGKSRYQLSFEEIDKILNLTEGSSFAQLDSIFREAAMFALRSDINCEYVNFTHFFK